MPGMRRLAAVLGFLGILIILVVFIWLVGLVSSGHIDALTFGTGILALATIVLASLTYWSVLNSNAKESRDRKEGILMNVLEWVEYIESSGTCDTRPEEKNLGMALAKGQTVLGLTSLFFRKELSERVSTINSNIAKMIALTGSSKYGYMGFDEAVADVIAAVRAKQKTVNPELFVRQDISAALTKQTNELASVTVTLIKAL
jgi:hypothetical protein